MEILECYTTTLMSASDSSASLEIYQGHLQSIFGFIEEIIKIDGYENTTILKSIISLIGDLATNFQSVPGIKD